MPSTLLFVGTNAGLMIFRSVGRGGSWQTTALSGVINAVVATDADTLVVTIAGAGAQQSFDGGENWMPSNEAAPAPIGTQVMTRNGAVPLANPRLSGATAYARLPGKSPTLLGAGAGGALLFRSSDDGIHWEPARMDSSVGRIVAIAPDAIGNGTAWAGSENGTLLRSTDYGQSWQVIDHAPAPITCLVAVAE